jgi:hypothetical protein
VAALTAPAARRHPLLPSKRPLQRPEAKQHAADDLAGERIAQRSGHDEPDHLLRVDEPDVLWSDQIQAATPSWGPRGRGTGSVTSSS